MQVHLHGKFTGIIGMFICLIIFQLTTLPKYVILIANSSLIRYIQIIADINDVYMSTYSAYEYAYIRNIYIRRSSSYIYKRGGFFNE